MHIATKESMELVATCLGHHPRGLVFSELVEELSRVLDAGEVRASLCAAVKDGCVRYACRKAGALALAAGEPHTEIAYFSGDRPVYSVGVVDEVDQVLQFLAQPVESARTQAILMGTWTAEQDLAYRGTREVQAVYDRFAGKMAPPVIGYALDVLREEGIVQFDINAGGLAFLKLIGMYRFTVMAQDLAKQKLRCFHVRAGSAEKAMEKVRSIPEGAGALDVQGSALDWLTYTPAPNKSFAIERI